MYEIVSIIQQIVELRLQMQEHRRLEYNLFSESILQLQFLKLAQTLHISLQQQLLLHLEVLVLLDLHLDCLLSFVHHLHGLDLLQPSAGILQALLPGLAVVLQLSPSAEALEDIVVLQQSIDMVGTVIRHIG